MLDIPNATILHSVLTHGVMRQEICPATNACKEEWMLGEDGDIRLLDEQGAIKLAARCTYAESNRDVYYNVMRYQF